MHKQINQLRTNLMAQFPERKDVNLADPASTQSIEILDAAREVATKVAALKAGDRKLYIAQAAQAVEQFDAQQAKLQELAKSRGRRAKAVISDTR